MKLLKIGNGKGYFSVERNELTEIDQIDKKSLLTLINLTLTEAVEFDPYDSNLLHNQAQRIVYKHIHEKLEDLRVRKDAFIDKSQRVYLSEYERYGQAISEDAS